MSERENELPDACAGSASVPIGSAATRLRRNAAFRVLWTARAVSAFGDSLTLVALILLLGGQAGQSFAVAALLLAGDFGPSLLGPMSGALSDRFDRRTVMMVCELVRACAVLTIAVTLPPLPVLLALVAVSAVAGQTLTSAAHGAVPLVVPDRRLESANSALGFGGHGMEAVGPFAAGLLLTFSSTSTVLILDAATSLFAASLLVRLRRLPPDGAAGEGCRGLLAGAGAGARTIVSTPVLRTVAWGFVAVVACNGVDDVALVFLAADELRVGELSTAMLYGAVGVGLVLGYLALSRRGPGSSMAWTLVVGCALDSAGNALTGLAGAVAVAVALQFVRGLGISGMDVGITTIVQRSVPASQLGRAFGTLYGEVGVAAATSYLVGAVAIQVAGPRTTFLVAGGLGLLVTLTVAMALVRRGGTARRAGVAGTAPDIR